MTDDQAILTLAAQIGNLADAINHLAVASQAARTPPGAAKPPAMPSAPQKPVGVPQGDSEAQIKRGKKIYAVCKSQQPEWDIQSTGENITGHAMNPNSQKWSEADQNAVLDTFSEWGVA